MTDQPIDAVIQADRDRAADFIEAHPWLVAGSSPDWMRADCKAIRAGLKDGNYIVRVLAAHRLAHTATHVEDAGERQKRVCNHELEAAYLRGTIGKLLLWAHQQGRVVEAGEALLMTDIVKQAQQAMAYCPSADGHYGDGPLLASLSPQSAPADMVLDRYDAGLLGDGGGGNVEWWQDYLRAELERAHEFYQDQAAAPQSAPVTQGAPE